MSIHNLFANDVITNDWIFLQFHIRLQINSRRLCWGNHVSQQIGYIIITPTESVTLGSLLLTLEETHIATMFWKGNLHTPYINLYIIHVSKNKIMNIEQLITVSCKLPPKEAIVFMWRTLNTFWICLFMIYDLPFIVNGNAVGWHRHKNHDYLVGRKYWI